MSLCFRRCIVNHLFSYLQKFYIMGLVFRNGYIHRVGTRDAVGVQIYIQSEIKTQYNHVEHGDSHSKT